MKVPWCSRSFLNKTSNNGCEDISKHLTVVGVAEAVHDPLESCEITNPT